MAEYAETAVLIAVMDGDKSDALERLRDFLPGELNTFQQQAEQVLTLIDCVRQERQGGGGDRG